MKKEKEEQESQKPQNPDGTVAEASPAALADLDDEDRPTGRIRHLDVSDVETPDIEAYAKKTRRINMALRILLLLAGMFMAAFGISLIAVLNLGSTPISSVPLVVSAITGYSFGTTTFLVNIFFVLGQVALLRRRFNPLNLLQIPSVFVFSVFIDISMHILGGVGGMNYIAALLLSLVGNLLLAIGIVMQIRSKTLVQPGEGIVLAVSVTVRKPFGYMKICNDVSLVALAALLSWFVLGEIVQVREGTLISAVIVGLLVKFIDGLRKRITGKD